MGSRGLAPRPVGDGDGDADVSRIETMTSRYLDPERLTGNGELRRMLEAAIDALPDEFRAVFVCVRSRA